MRSESRDSEIELRLMKKRELITRKGEAKIILGANNGVQTRQQPRRRRYRVPKSKKVSEIICGTSGHWMSTRTGGFYSPGAISC